MKMQFKLFPVMIAVFLLTLAGCGIANIRTEGGQLAVDVNMSESQVNSLINLAISRSGNVTSDFLLDQISSVDFIEPDTMRVFGSAGGVEGSYDMTISAADGALQIAVADVNVPGISMDDPRIEKANEALTTSFTNSARSENDGRFTNAAVEGDQLTITIEVALGR